MLKRNQKAPRRRPGDSFTLYRVDRGMGPNPKSKMDWSGEGPYGYLVTNSDRNPKVLAFVPGVSPQTLKHAIHLRSDPSAIRRSPQAIDLRDRTGPQVAREFLGLWLVPVDNLGRRITNDKDFEACGFTEQRYYDRSGRMGGAHLAFYVWMQGGFQMMLDGLAKQKSGTSAKPNILPPGSKEDEPSLSLTA
jgi:hypothetical protein